MWLYEAKQVIGAQIHSHPTDAYHSDTDNTFPIATLDGSLSIVLPYFGREGWKSSGVAAFRLGQSGWDEVTGPLSDLIEIDDSGVS